MSRVAPSGEQYEIASNGYRAVVTEGGAALRLLEHEGRPLIDGFAEDEMPSGGRGQLLMPWPNRIRDGVYDFGGSTHQLGLTEASRHNASHGLVRWASWTLEEHTEVSVSLVYRLVAQSGYPWTIDLHVLYDLSAEGLTVTQTATNLSTTAAPYACGAHPYLLAATDAPTIEGWELTLPASVRLRVDDRKLPISSTPVADTEYDFRLARPLHGIVLDDCFGDLEKPDGCITVTLRDPTTGQGTQVWGDSQVHWVQVYTGDDGPTPRRSIAVEPMTAPPDAFRSGTDLVTLAPAEEPGDEHTVSWGIAAV